MSSDWLERAALLHGAGQPRALRRRRPASGSASRARFGYGASPGMTRRCLERVDEEGIRGGSHPARALRHPPGRDAGAGLVRGRALGVSDPVSWFADRAGLGGRRRGRRERRQGARGRRRPATRHLRRARRSPPGCSASRTTSRPRTSVGSPKAAFSSLHGDRHALQRVVHVAAVFHSASSGWVLPAASVARSRARARRAWRPTGRPASPPVVAGRLAELCVVPRLAAVGADLDARDRRPARPGSALEQAGAGLEEPVALREVGDAGRDEQRARVDPRHRLARSSSVRFTRYCLACW